MADCLTCLPPEVLQQLLRYLDQYYLTCITPLVCKTLRNTARAALQRVKAELVSQARSDQFTGWLQAQGYRYVRHLEVSTAHPAVDVVLQFTQEAQHLKELLIWGGRYTTQPSFNALPELTSLSIHDITADGLILQSIAALSHLSSLSLHGIDFGPAIATSSRDGMSSGAQQIWSNCRQVTSLRIAHCDLDDAAVAQLTQQLTALQHLDLSCNQLKAAAKLAPLPGSLTYLNLSRNHLHFDVSELLAWSSAPVSGNCSSAEGVDSPNQQQLIPICQHLQHLEISRVSLSHPQLLSGLVALTNLQAQALQIPSSEDLLLALRFLTGVRHLNLCGTFSIPGFVRRMAADIPLLNEALQAMSHLTHLDIGNCLIAPCYGPEEHRPPTANILTAKLPELKVLNLEVLVHRGMLGPNQIVMPSDLQMIVQNCPCLQQLHLCGRINPATTGSDLQPLLQLTGSLTNLSLGGQTYTVGDDVLSIVQQLTNLHELVVLQAGGATDVGMMTLTNLKQLRHLSVKGFSSIGKELPQRLYENGEWELELKSKPGKAPDVWQQLAKRCKRIPACLVARQKWLEHNLAAAQQGAGQKHAGKAAKQAAALQKEIAQLKQQLELLHAKSSQGSQ